jgi:ABC-type transport system involved in multi-copper enzyme maturation permease subunit
MSAAIVAIGNTLIKELLRRKEVFLMLFLALAILIGAASLSFFNVDGIEKYLREISMNITMLFTVLITIGLTARQIPLEIERKTLYPILTKPCSRWQFLLGKYFGVIAAAIISLIFFHASCLLVFFFKGIKPGFVYVEAVILQICGLGLLAAMALFLSTILSSPAAVVGIGLLAYFFFKWFGANIELLIDRSSGALGTIVPLIYTIIPHFEFFDLSQKVIFSSMYAPVGILDMLFFVGYAMVYSTFFLSVSWLIFRKKQL